MPETQTGHGLQELYFESLTWYSLLLCCDSADSAVGTLLIEEMMSEESSVTSQDTKTQQLTSKIILKNSSKTRNIHTIKNDPKP